MGLVTTKAEANINLRRPTRVLWVVGPSLIRAVYTSGVKQTLNMGMLPCEKEV